MDRAEFEKIRALPKAIFEDIKFKVRPHGRPAMVARVKVGVLDDEGDGDEGWIELYLDITYNPENEHKTFNVSIGNVGPICRLDVDTSPHKPASGSHKHTLQKASCPAKNIPFVKDRSDLAGKKMAELFAIFCEMANIRSFKKFESPDP